MTISTGVFKEIIPNGLCIGCGMCAAVAPEDLAMLPTPDGRFEPQLRNNAQIGRWEDVSLAVCPFADNPVNEDVIGRSLFDDVESINHTPETGFFLECFSGHVCDVATAWLRLPVV